METYTPPRRRLHDFWRFYRRYTDTTVHTATTVALAAFGLLIFVDPWFAALAIGSYALPPVFLYALDEPIALDHARTPVETPGMDLQQRTAVERRQSVAADPDSESRPTAIGDAPSGADRYDAESRDGDSDSDGRDGDSDSDGHDGDTDTDGSDGDTDTDGRDGDSDSDGFDGDSDSDR